MKKVQNLGLQAGLLCLALSSGVSFADGSGHTHMMGEQAPQQGHMMGDQDHMMTNEQMSDMHQQMRDVMGTGTVNKIMGDKHMVNISHEPISDLNWPKMRMNFKTEQGVDLSNLKPGQVVNFTLQVDKDNNYLIKDIKVVK